MSESPRRWVKLLVPIAGLSIIPLVGLVYVATTTFGSGAAKADGSADVRDVDPASGKSNVTKPKAKGSRPAPARAAAAKGCCEKLHDLAQVADVDKRATYMAAGAACDGAENDDQALKQVASIVGGDRVDMPPECKNNP